jgi:hypothetical protein
MNIVNYFCPFAAYFAFWDSLRKRNHLRFQNGSEYACSAAAADQECGNSTTETKYENYTPALPVVYVIVGCGFNIACKGRRTGSATDVRSR